MEIYRTDSVLTLLEPLLVDSRLHVHVDRGDGRCECGEIRIGHDVLHIVLRSGDRVVAESVITL